MSSLNKAVIPIAGLGTRFLPATKKIPKVMMPVFDRPAIHFAVEEAARSGIEHIVLVMSEDQHAALQYFDRLPALEDTLLKRGQTDRLQQMIEITEMAEISCVYQQHQLGLGHAILETRSVIGNEPFAVLLPDDLIRSESPTISDMTKLALEHQGNIIAVKEVSEDSVSSVGIVEIKSTEDRISRVANLVEKPKPADAPSNLAIVGRYVLYPEIFECITQTSPGALGEVQLTDAIVRLLPTSRTYAYHFPGIHFDIGTPLGLLKASIHTALNQYETSASLRDWIQENL